MPIKVKTRRLKAELRGGKHVVIPAWVVDSGKPGPCMLLTAAQHGNEVQGCETIRRFVDLARKELTCGKVCAVPMVNIPAIRDRRPHIRMGPEQPYGDARGHNMNRWWPGKKSGNATARIPYAIYQAFGREATHVLDLHCWEKHHAAAVLVRDVPGLRELAAKLGHRFVDVRPPSDHTLGGHFCATGRVGVTYEFSGQYVMNEWEIARGLRMMTNYAKAIGLLPGPLSKGDSPVLFSDECGSIQVEAPCTGMFVAAERRTCEPIKKGDLIGHIISDASLKCRDVRAPKAGFLRAFGASRANCDVAMPGHHPYVTQGERVAAVVFRRRK